MFYWKILKTLIEIKMLKEVGTTEAAFLLNISVQRLRQLLIQERIKGARKVGRMWLIPLFGKMPKVIEGKRGPQGTWRKRLSCTKTQIYINRNVVRKNREHKTNDPTIILRRGNEVKYYHQIRIKGESMIVYHPDSRNRSGAVVWIEADPTTIIEPLIFANFS